MKPKLIRLGENYFVDQTCSYCSKNYLQIKSAFYSNRKYGIKSYCSDKCNRESRRDRIIVSCGYCSQKIEIIPSTLIKSKSKEVFCSQSCSGSFNNRNKTHGYIRSKSEIYLSDLIKLNYPKLIVENNNKTICKGLELDIIILSIKLAIEWNGIVHYKPIYGQNKLDRIQKLDKERQAILSGLGWTLIQIQDISKKYNEQYILQEFQKIKLIIDNLSFA